MLLLLEFNFLHLILPVALLLAGWPPPLPRTHPFHRGEGGLMLWPWPWQGGGGGTRNLEHIYIYILDRRYIGGHTTQFYDIGRLWIAGFYGELVGIHLQQVEFPLLWYCYVSLPECSHLTIPFFFDGRCSIPAIQVQLCGEWQVMPSLEPCCLIMMLSTRWNPWRMH